MPARLGVQRWDLPAKLFWTTDALAVSKLLHAGCSAADSRREAQALSMTLFTAGVHRPHFALQPSDA